MGKAYKQEPMNTNGLLLSICGAIFGWTLGQIGSKAGLELKFLHAYWSLKVADFN